MSKLGRNDPCHCGSGKKYKKCHMEADQRSRVAHREPPPEFTPPTAGMDFRAVANQIRELSRRGPASKGFRDIISKAEPLLDYLEREDEINAVAKQLEPHWQEFEKLVADADRYGAAVRALCSEECFAPCRFTASEVRRAFEEVGYPSTISVSEETTKVLRAAILHVADKDRRARLATALLVQLPEFVAAGRYMDACLLRMLASDTSENQDEGNPLLFYMFSFGYDAWIEEKRTANITLLQKLDVDLERLRSMSADELDAWIESMKADAQKSAILDAFFKKHPDLHDESVANLNALRKDSSKLLSRPDADLFFLSPEEVMPWLEEFAEITTQNGFSLAANETMNEEEVRNLFDQVALPMMREMATDIFKPERIQQLILDLKKYRDEYFAGRDHETAALASAAMNYLKDEDSPGENTFLLTLCWASIASALKALQPETNAEGC